MIKQNSRSALQKAAQGVWDVLFFLMLAGSSALFAAQDISDRAYLPAVLEQFKGAQKSIEVSMYSIAVGSAANDPAWQLMEALKRAAARGVRVRVWMNSRQASIGSTRIFLRSDIQESLRKAGLKIYYTDSKKRLHDKLIVIDAKTVIEGSMNWTREALTRNFESASVIEDSELAGIKIRRLEAFPLLKDTHSVKKQQTQETFLFPAILLKDASKFPAALEEKEARSLALYLSFLEKAQSEGQDTFTLDLEVWSRKLRFKNPKLGWFLQNDMKRHLDFLKNRYGLIEWKEIQKGEVEVTLLLTNTKKERGDIRVPQALVQAGYVKTLTAKTLFVYLIVLEKSQKEGQVPFWMGNLDDVALEFHTNRTTLIQGLTELKQANLLEIFPSEKKIINGQWQREFTNRYLLNPVLSEREKQEAFAPLIEKYGEAQVSKARDLAGQLDESEDPEVTAQFLSFLKSYSEEDVKKATALTAGYSRNNPLRTAAYVRGILEGEKMK